MRLKHRLALLMVATAAVPIVLVGWSAVTISARTAVAAAEDSERRQAEATGARVAAEVERLRVLLRLFARRSFDFAALQPSDLIAAEKLLYGLDDRITATSILRADGSAAAPSYYRRADDPGPRTALGALELADHASQVPLGAALAGEDAISPIYRNRTGGVRVALAVASEPSDSQAVRAVIVAEVDLAELVTAVAPGALLFDGAGRLAVGPAGSPRPTLEQPARWAGGIAVHHGSKLCSFAAVPALGWGVGIERPLAEVLAPVRRMQASIVLWVVGFALAALLVGLLVSRGITRPLEGLARAARDLGAGRLDRRVDEGGYLEAALVGRSFNQMANELSRSQAELKRWNAELEDMVKSRTAELREAIDQLLLAHRLAAIGQLGAGVAHEINNPLTYLLGALQLVEKTPPAKQGELLTRSLEAARRIQQVVAALLVVSQPRGDGERVATDLNGLIESAIRLVEGQLAQHKITVKRTLEAGLPLAYVDPSQLVQALVQILNNARDAMPEGGTITIESRGAIGDKLLLLRVSDTGRGIATEHFDRLFDPFFTTRAGDGHKGLGLSLAYRIIKDHGGTIQPESQIGIGTRFVVRLPALPRAMSLA